MRTARRPRWRTVSPPLPGTRVPGTQATTRAKAGLGIGVVVAGALALRLPALLADRHLSFDDGVYGASAVAMRDGELPFRQVFSSQGPLFLPLVWLADLLGLRTLDAPRLLAVASGGVVVAATWATAAALRLRPRSALVAAVLVAASGGMLWVTGPLTSDGPAVALATVSMALAIAYRRAPSARLALLCGLCLGGALSVKSLLVGVAAPIFFALVANRRHLALAVGAAAAVSLACVLPWGVAAVWDQAFLYHLEAAGSRTPVANVGKIFATLADRDLPLLAGAVAVAVASLLVRPPPARADSRQDGRGREARLVPLVAGWLIVTAAVLVLEHPLWRNHLAHLVPPLALLVAVGIDRLERLAPTGPAQRRAWTVAGAVTLVALVPYHLIHNRGILAPPGPAGAEAAARADLAALPAGAWAISDDPGLVWRSGRRTPADLVDTSILRISSGRITADSLAAAAAERHVCALLVWSPRFGDLAGLPSLLDGYQVSARYGGPRVLYQREGCRP